MNQYGKVLAAVLLAAFVAGCGIWSDITGDSTEEVYLKGDPGMSCSLDSECRSNVCEYPGVCR